MAASSGPGLGQEETDAAALAMSSSAAGGGGAAEEADAVDVVAGGGGGGAEVVSVVFSGVGNFFVAVSVEELPGALSGGRGGGAEESHFVWKNGNSDGMFMIRYYLLLSA